MLAMRRACALFIMAATCIFAFSNVAIQASYHVMKLSAR